MSIKLMTMVWQSKSLSGNHRLVALALADNANDECVCWPSVNTIAHKANISRRYCMVVLSELCAGGFIEVERRRNGKRNFSNIYKIIPEKFPPDKWSTTEKPSTDWGVWNHQGSDLGNTTLVNPESLPVVNPESPGWCSPNHPEPSIEPPIEPKKEPKKKRPFFSGSGSTPPALPPQPEHPAYSGKIFQLYEKNIGGIVPPSLMQEMAQAETEYPLEQLEAAFGIAARNNKRSWQYVRGILRKYTQQGFVNPEDDKPKPTNSDHNVWTNARASNV